MVSTMAPIGLVTVVLSLSVLYGPVGFCHSLSSLYTNNKILKLFTVTFYTYAEAHFKTCCWLFVSLLMALLLQYLRWVCLYFIFFFNGLSFVSQKLRIARVPLSIASQSLETPKTSGSGRDWRLDQFLPTTFALLSQHFWNWCLLLTLHHMLYSKCSLLILEISFKTIFSRCLPAPRSRSNSRVS